MHCRHHVPTWHQCLPPSTPPAPHRNQGKTLLVRVDLVTGSSGVALLALSQPVSGFAPYRVDNCSGEVLHVQQERCVEQEDVLRAYTSLPFAWDEPSLPHRVLLLLPGHRLLGKFSFEQLGQQRDIIIAASSDQGHSRARRLRVTVSADGPARVLSVIDLNAHPQQQQEAAGAARKQPSSKKSAEVGSRASSGSGAASSAISAASGAAMAVQQAAAMAAMLPGAARSSSTPAAASLRQHLLHTSLKLPAIGLSLVSGRQELLYLRANHLGAVLRSSESRSSLHVKLGMLRCDNTLPEAQHKVALYCPVARTMFDLTYLGSSGQGEAPSARASAVVVEASWWHQQRGDVLCFERLSITLQPLAVNLEGQHLRVLKEFADGCAAISSSAASKHNSPHAAAAAAAARRRTSSMRRSSTGGSRQQWHAHGAQPGAGQAQQGAAAPAVGPCTWQETLQELQSRMQQRKVYFEDLQISQIKVCATFAPGSWFTDPQPAAAADTHAGAGSSSAAAAAASEGAPWWVQLFLSLAAAEGAWVQLAPLQVQHPVLGAPDFGQLLARHYVSSLYYELPRLLVSLDIFGDPVRLVQGLGLGVYQLVMLPRHGGWRAALLRDA